MSATIITSPGKLAVSNGIKVKIDVLDYPQTIVNQDFSKTKCYPSQANPVPLGTEFVNLATAGPLIGQGFVPDSGVVNYSAANKSISLGANSGRLKFGSAAAPYPLLGIGGQTTDLLITMMIKPGAMAVTSPRQILELSSLRAGTSLEKLQFLVSYNYVLNKLDLYGFGLNLPVIDLPYEVWTHIALYLRCNTYNGKTGLATGYKNGVLASTRTTGIPDAFFATDDTIPMTIAPNSTANCEIGEIKIMKGLDAANLNPATLIAQDYAYAAAKWPNAA